MTICDVYTAVFLMLISYDRSARWQLFPHPKTDESVPLDWRSDDLMEDGEYVWELDGEDGFMLIISMANAMQFERSESACFLEPY